MEKQQHSFLSEFTVEEASRLLKAISDPTRIKLLYLLFQEECSVGHITEVLELSQSAVSHQLSYLRKLKLVKYRKVKNISYYTYSDEHVVGILNQVIQHVEECKE
ncbi:ArsR/SmtB family transcription factor [Rossellomorea sp. BNER]|uniref:ArsR/SmtB family transcription factor n=1 Tax=Rossellomorea sp. BNER TaxID=2962031 RepID=UPI003AF1E538|nr:metalloregulator ArsR/SmtB family transcription factor [Rossellomorea sp. BNER]